RYGGDAELYVPQTNSAFRGEHAVKDQSKSTMDHSRASRLSHFKFQIRTLKQRESSIVFLNNKTSQGLKPKTQRELVRVRQDIQDAEAQLDAFLRGH
ncbi:MAG: hypothetical protein ACRYFU_23475, partial [Janthinobacterium lividum]